MFNGLSQLLGMANVPENSRSSQKQTGAISTRINIESRDYVTLFDTAKDSAGALFSATFLMAVHTAEASVSSVSVDFLQHTVIQHELAPTCRACSDQSTGGVVPIMHWELLPSPKTFKRGEYTLPFSCHIPGDLPATSTLGIKSATKVHYELLATVKYTTSAGATKSYSTRKPIEVKRVLPVNSSPKLEHRSFEPSATVIDTLIADNAFVGRRNQVRMFIRNVTGENESAISGRPVKKTNRRWAVRNVDCHLYEVVRNKSQLCPEHDGEKKRRKFQEQTEQRKKSSVYDLLKSSNPLVRSFFEDNGDGLDTDEVVTEMFYRVASVVVEPQSIKTQFLENNDIETSFKIDFSDQLERGGYCADVDYLGVSVRHKVIVEVTLAEEEISYERMSCKIDQPREQEQRPVDGPDSKLRDYYDDDDDNTSIEPKPCLDSNGNVMRICVDRTGHMQKLKTVFRQALSDIPKEDNLPWEEDVPPCYNTVIASGGAPPVYVTA